MKTGLQNCQQINQITLRIFLKILTSDDKTREVRHPRATLWLGDTAIQILILISDFFEMEGGGEPSVVDVFGQSHRNIFSISPLNNTHREEG